MLCCAVLVVASFDCWILSRHCLAPPYADGPAPLTPARIFVLLTFDIVSLALMILTCAAEFFSTTLSHGKAERLSLFQKRFRWIYWREITHSPTHYRHKHMIYREGN